MSLSNDRRDILLKAMGARGLTALVELAPSDVLLLSEYWPVMGSSVAVLTAEGILKVVLPEDEVELATACSGANLISYKPASLSKLMSFPLPLLSLRGSLPDR